MGYQNRVGIILHRFRSTNFYYVIENIYYFQGRYIILYDFCSFGKITNNMNACTYILQPYTNARDQQTCSIFIYILYDINIILCTEYNIIIHHNDKQYIKYGKAHRLLRISQRSSRLYLLLLHIGTRGRSALCVFVTRWLRVHPHLYIYISFIIRYLYIYIIYTRIYIYLYIIFRSSHIAKILRVHPKTRVIRSNQMI